MPPMLLPRSVVVPKYPPLCGEVYRDASRDCWGGGRECVEDEAVVVVPVLRLRVLSFRSRACISSRTSSSAASRSRTVSSIEERRTF